MRFVYRFIDQAGAPVTRAALTITKKGQSKALFKGALDPKGVVAVEIDDRERNAEVRLSLLATSTRKELYRAGPLSLSKVATDRIVAVGAAADDKTPIDVGAPMIKSATSLAEFIRGRGAAEQKVGSEVMRAAASEIQRRTKQRKDGKALARRLLGSKPRGKLGAGALFVPRAADPAKTILKAQREGLARLAGTPRRGVLLRGKPAGIDTTKEASLTPAQAAGLMASLPAPGGVQSGLAALLNCCAAVRRAGAAEQQAPAGAASTMSASSAPPSPNLAARLAALLDLSLGTAALAARPDSAAIGASLQTSVPAGPADVDAYYDFHSLQIAWQDAWTAVVDGRTDATIRDLYDSIVAVVPAESVDADLSEVDELHEMLDALAETAAIASAALSAPTDLLAWEPAIATVWSNLSFSDQDYLRFLKAAEQAVAIMGPILAGLAAAGHPTASDETLAGIAAFKDHPREWIPGRTVVELAADEGWARRLARALVAAAAPSGARLGRAEKLIIELKERLAEPYQFDVFAPGAHNFGILATYRQKWRPLSYQAGDLAGAMALAPNERRSFSVTRKTTRQESRRTSSTSVHGGSSEIGATSRAESEIARATTRSMSAKAHVEGDYGKEGIWHVGATSDLGTEQGATSNQTKKDIREATRKAAQDYRDERKVELNVESGSEESVSETREIQNPNNELTVTYLFYELQRRFEVSERLHDIRPVVLVAYAMPAPHEIDEAFLLRYDWIIAEVLLDRTFESALRHVRTSFAGDELSVEILEQQWRTQLALVAEMRRQSGAHQSLRDVAREAMESAVSDAAVADAGSEFFRGGIGRTLWKRLFAAKEALAEGESENAREALDWANVDLAQVEASAREAATALERATAAYVEAVQTRLNRRTAIDRLLLHIKENIFHYMQAIWRREHADQRYLRLYDMEIQWPGTAGAAVVRRDIGSLDVGWPRFAPRHGAKPLPAADARLVLPVPEFRETRRLHQVADLDKLIGFRGNLAVFRVRENNALTSYMAQDFLDSHFGVVDPDPLGEVPTAEEAIDIAECAWRSDGVTDADKVEISAWLIDALDAAHKVSQEVVVPTGELFIEALPGAHPLLEDFKLRHRAYDAQKARAGALMAEIEALRRAMRLEAGDATNPENERSVRIDGSAPTNVTVDAG